MRFQEFIRQDIKDFLDIEYPIYFFWDRAKSRESEYVVYQTEDLEISNKLDNDYLNLLDNAIHVYEYSEMNLQHYSRSEFKPFLPRIDLKYTSENEQSKDIDVLFYGYLSDRRQSLIKKIENEMNLNTVHIEEMTLDEMRSMISRSRWVLSVGTHSNLHNDLLRVTPALNLGASILLEETQETWYNDFLKTNFPNRVRFI